MVIAVVNFLLLYVYRNNEASNASNSIRMDSFPLRPWKTFLRKETNMPDRKFQILQHCTRFLGIIAMAVLMVSCVDTPPIPRSTLPSSTHPRSITGEWQGCIQGDNGPNETMTLTITTEKKDGTLGGTYYENYGYSFLFASDNRTADNVPIYKAKISANNQVQFSVDVRRGTSNGELSGEAIDFYVFKGVLVKNGFMQGQVSQTPNVFAGQTHAYGWTLSKDGKCPY